MDVALVLFTRDLRARDNPALARECARHRMTLEVTPGHAVVPAGELRPAGGDHYRVFTPYWRAWQAAAWRQPHEVPPSVRVPACSRPGAAGPRTWARDLDALDAWREGSTGIPIVDAGLRQFAVEGLSCSLDSEVSYTILSSSDTMMVRVEGAEVCGRAGVTPPGPDGSRGESYPLSVSAFAAREGWWVPGGLSGSHRGGGRPRRAGGGAPRPGGRRPFAAARWAMLTIAQCRGTVHA